MSVRSRAHPWWITSQTFSQRCAEIIHERDVRSQKYTFELHEPDLFWTFRAMLSELFGILWADWNKL